MHEKGKDIASGAMKTTGAVGKGFMVVDASMKLKGASVNANPTRSSVAPCQKTLGPRT